MLQLGAAAEPLRQLVCHVAGDVVQGVASGVNRSASKLPMTTRRALPTEEEVWRTYDRMEQRLTAPVSERMLDLAGLRPGMRVLDLATGRGEPAIRAAHRVGPTGTVVGVDVSEAMLRMTRERAVREGVANLDLHTLNAESLAGVPTSHFHAVLARWGVMYFQSPVAALSAARRAMLPGGLLVAACWAEPERVPYFTVPRRVLEQYQALPAIDQEAPGTFRYADIGRIDRDFAAAGLGIEHLEEHDVTVMEAETDAALIAWTRTFGMARMLNDLPDEVQRAWEADLLNATKPLWHDGRIRLGGVTRIVVARPNE
jgi:ubiquinone/menaquinone biosynthesis C-methylase UbiE